MRIDSRETLLSEDETIASNAVVCRHSMCTGSSRTNEVCAVSVVRNNLVMIMGEILASLYAEQRGLKNPPLQKLSKQGSLAQLVRAVGS